MTPSGSETSLSIIESTCSSICRICHCEGQEESPLLSPCSCSGTLGHVHQLCLQQWIKSAEITSCELCKFPYVMQIRTKPFRKWNWMQLQRGQNRKLFMSIATNLMVLAGMVFSVYIFISRLHNDLEGHRRLDWHTWVKLIIVALSVLGGSVFMYMQSQLYMNLFRKWESYNKVICIQDKPEKFPFLADNSNDYELNHGTKNNSETLPLVVVANQKVKMGSQNPVSHPPPQMVAVIDVAQNVMPDVIVDSVTADNQSISNKSLDDLPCQDGEPILEDVSLGQQVSTLSTQIAQPEDSTIVSSILSLDNSKTK